MYSVYILFSERDGRLYVGQTINLEARFKRHQNGLVLATKHRRPLSLIHSEKFATRGEAMKRELFLTSLWGSRTKKKILKAYLDSRPKTSSDV